MKIRELFQLLMLDPEARIAYLLSYLLRIHCLPKTGSWKDEEAKFLINSSPLEYTNQILYLKSMFFTQYERPLSRPPKTPNDGQNYCFLYLYINLRFSRQENGEEVF
jgi:hypothetical protein